MSWLVVTMVIAWSVAILLVLSVFRVRGLIRRLRRLVIVVLWMSGGIALTALVLLQHTFSVFTGETLVATVITRQIAPRVFELVYTPASSDTARAKTVQLKGDQWSISGGIVKWHLWVNFLGIKSYHRPMRLSGQFSQLEQQRAHLPTVEPLAPSMDWVWEMFYWGGRHLPFVDAVYGSSAYAYVEPGTVQKIYVTPSGYLIQSARAPEGR